MTLSGSSPTPCTAGRTPLVLWRCWSMRRPAAIRSSQSSSSRKAGRGRACSGSTARVQLLRRPGSGTLDRIRAKGYSDNVVDLMLGKLLKYLHAGRSLLSEEAWERNYDLIFSIESLMAECELLTADMAAAEGRLTMLAQRARSRHDFAVVTRLQVTLYTTLDRSDRAIEVFLDYLRRNGTDWSPHPTRDDVMREYNRIWSLVGDRQIEDLVDLPLTMIPMSSTCSMCSPKSSIRPCFSMRIYPRWWSSAWRVFAWSTVTAMRRVSAMSGLGCSLGRASTITKMDSDSASWATISSKSAT
jgi:hypothetical protein